MNIQSNLPANKIADPSDQSKAQSIEIGASSPMREISLGNRLSGQFPKVETNQSVEDSFSRLLAQLQKVVKDLLSRIMDRISSSLSGFVDSIFPPVSDQPDQTNENPDSSSFAQKIKSTLRPDPNGKVHEEQLQHGIVAHLLEKSTSVAASGLYQQTFDALLSQGWPMEDAVKAALKEVVAQGIISGEQAEEINGISFKAAQLDANDQALYDGRGGPGDPTIALASMEEAISRAQAVLQKIDARELEVKPRSLDAPSNGIPGAKAATTTGNSFPASPTVGHGFLWKPVSESDGKLVVLLPPSLTGQVASSAIYSALPPSPETLIEEGRFSGDSHNGGRAHFRFSQAGAAYPDGVFVVALMKDGSSVNFPIGETSQRNS